MAKVTNIEDAKPHINGKVICLDCRKTWIAVCPVGTLDFQCPDCLTWKGVFEGMTSPGVVWECSCGNQHFFISETEAMCARCGYTQVFP